MPQDVVLTTDQQLWDVLRPLLGKLENTVAKRFPEEAIAVDRLNMAKRAQSKIEEEQTLFDAATAAVSALEKSHDEQKETALMLSKYEKNRDFHQNAVQGYEQEVTKIQRQLDNLRENEKDQKGFLEQVLTKAQQDYEGAKSLQAANERLITQSKEKLGKLPQEITENHLKALSALEQVKLKEKYEYQLNQASTFSELKNLISSHKEEAARELIPAKAQVATYESEITKLAKKYRANRANIATAIEKVWQQQGKDYLELAPHLKKLSKVTPGIYGQTVADFNTACDSAEHLKNVEAVQKDLSEKYKAKLNSPGDSHTATIETELGVGFSIGIADVRATVIVGVEVEVKKEADGRLTAVRKGIGKFKVRARGGAEISTEVEAKIRASVEGGLNISKARKYDSMEDFVAEESNTYMAAVMAGAGGKKKRAYIAETEALLREANNNFSQLQKRLTLFGALKDKKLLLTKQKHIDKVISNTLTGSIDGSASTVFKVNTFGAGIGLGEGGSMSTITEYRAISYLDDITEEPVLQKIYAMKNPKNMGFFTVDSEKKVKYLTSEQAINELDRIEKDIIRLKSEQGDSSKENLETHQQNLLNSMKLLQQEYDSYITLQNYVNHENKLGDANKRINELNTRRGALDAADYVKSMALQFASIRRLYESAFDSETNIPEEAKALSQAFSEDLKIPRIKMSHTSLERAFGIDAKTKATIVKGFNGYFSIDVKGIGEDNSNNSRGGLNFKVAASYEEVQVPDQPIEEKIKLKFNTTLGSKGDNYVTQLFQIADLTKRFKKDGPKIQEDLKAAFANIADGCVEVDFVQVNGHWVLKTVKGYDEQDRTIGGKLTIGADTQLIAGLTRKSKDKRLRNVYFGTKTLSALTDLYRAKHFGDAGSDDNWDNFRKDSKLLKRMVAQLKAENPEESSKKRITADLKMWMKDLSMSQDIEDRNAVGRFEEVWNNGEGDDTAIESALNDLVKRKVKKDDKAIAEAFIRRRNLERHEINDYAARVITSHMDTLVSEYRAELGVESVEGVKDLLTKAKSVYEKERSEKNFKLLKKAFAIDYASNQLDELVRNGSAEDQKKAVAMLGSHIENILDGDQVYLNDRVEGKIIRRSDGNLEIQPIIRKGLSRTINEKEIVMLAKNKVSGLPASPLAAKKISSSGHVVAWENKSYKAELKRQHSVARFQKRHGLRSMKTRFKWSNKISISEAIAKVMEERYKKQQKQKRDARQRQRTSNSSQVSAQT